MIGLPGRIVEAIQNGPENQAPAAVSLAGISPVDGTMVIQERAFQWWPESLQEDPEIGWSFKEIPGMAHALAQWTQNGGRTFTFEVQCSRSMRPWASLSGTQQLKSMGLNRPSSTAPIDNSRYNISVKDQIQWLRQFYLPNYVNATVSGVPSTVSQPPPIAMLNFPSMGLNEDGSDVIWAVMTQCAVSYALCFPSGEPRLASVSLGFKQVIQHPVNGLILKTRKMYEDAKGLRETDISVGGGRKVSGGPVKGP